MEIPHNALTVKQSSPLQDMMHLLMDSTLFFAQK